MGLFAVQQLPLAVSPFCLGPHFYKPLLTIYVLTVSGVMWAVTKPPGIKGLEKVPLRRCLSFLVRSDLSPLSLSVASQAQPQGQPIPAVFSHSPFCVFFFCSDRFAFLMPWSSVGCPCLSLLSFPKNTSHFSNQLWDRPCVCRLCLNVPPHPSMGNPRAFLIICKHKHLVHVWSR